MSCKATLMNREDSLWGALHNNKRNHHLNIVLKHSFFSEERDFYPLPLPYQREFILAGHTAQIADGITHASQCRIDADSQHGSYFLEGEVLVVT